MDLKRFRTWYEKNQKKLETNYFELLSIPSISTDPKYKHSVDKAAKWVKQFLESCLDHVECIETKGHPVVFGESVQQEGLPTLLLYGHYDVQPVDPLNEWEKDPFEPFIKEGRVYARGAQDNKGQLIYVLHSLLAMKEVSGRFPINIKVFIEGEEECSSPSLTTLLPKIQKKIQSDYLLVVDGGILGENEPCITLGCRGMAALEVFVEGSNQDLHSGYYGNVAYNPLRALSQVVSKLWNKEGEVAVPGFYEDVRYNSTEGLSFPKYTLQGEEGLTAFWKDGGMPPEKSCKLRPSIEVHGFRGGYTDEGFKTVIPKKASVKLSARLVASQEPEKIFSLLESFFEKELPKGMKRSFKRYGGGLPLKLSKHSLFQKACQKAYEEVFQKPCQKVLSGGSIPIAKALADAAEAEPLIIGLGLPGDLIHAPNEHFSLKRVELGFYVVVRTIQLLESYYRRRCDENPSKKAEAN